MNNYIASPVNTAKGGLLVLHAWWGLNVFQKTICNRLADEGYLTIAPDLYHGEIAATIEQADQLRSKIKRATIATNILATLDFLRARPEMSQKAIGVVGFSMGAWWALWLNEQHPDSVSATVLFYGTRGMKSTATQSAFCGHFAERDLYEPASSARRLEKKLKTAGKDTEFHTYAGTSHWFFEEDRPEYHPEAANLAWARTLGFLHNHLMIPTL